MVGIIVNGKKYIESSSSVEIKKKSLEDNVYYTLEEIFLNGEEADCVVAKKFIDELKDVSGYYYSDYTDVLYDYNSNYTTNLFNYLDKFTKNQIYFVNGEKLDGEKKYIGFDDWWARLENLINELKNQLFKHKEWENDDVERDCDRLYEIEYD